MILLVAAFASPISATNECCNVVFCHKVGQRKFNSGLYLIVSWVMFIFGVILLYFATMREMNSDCPEYKLGAPFKIVQPGVFVSGGILGFISVICSVLYYLDSLTMAGIKGEHGLLSIKRKNGLAPGEANAKKLVVNNKGAAETEMVTVDVSS